MAILTNTSKSVLGQISPVSNLIGTSGDTLVYTAGAGQELLLYNIDTVSHTITIDGAGGTVVPVPGAGAATFSVAPGVVYTILAGAYAVVRLDTIPAYCNGSPVTIVADVAAKVAACIIQ